MRLVENSYTKLLHLVHPSRQPRCQPGLRARVQRRPAVHRAEGSKATERAGASGLQEAISLQRDLVKVALEIQELGVRAAQVMEG
jgi:hypothetical protein